MKNIISGIIGNTDVSGKYCWVIGLISLCTIGSVPAKHITSLPTGIENETSTARNIGSLSNPYFIMGTVARRASLSQ